MFMAIMFGYRNKKTKFEFASITEQNVQLTRYIYIYIYVCVCVCVCVCAHTCTYMHKFASITERFVYQGNNQTKVIFGYRNVRLSRYYCSALAVHIRKYKKIAKIQLESSKNGYTNVYNIGTWAVVVVLKLPKQPFSSSFSFWAQRPRRV